MERRFHERYRFRSGVTISWTSVEGDISCVGNCYEASTYGISAEASQLIPVGTKATIRLDQFDQGVEATVRHCRKHGTWYRIGLRFSKVAPPVFQK